MNRVTIINGVKGEGKTSELLSCDMMNSLKNNNGLMKIIFVSPQELSISNDLVEYMLTGIREEFPDFAKGETVDVRCIDDIDDFIRLVESLDSSTVMFLDSVENIRGLTTDKVLSLIDKYEFDCHMTRQRSISDRDIVKDYKIAIINTEDLLVSDGGRELVSKKIHTVNFNLFTGKECQFDGLESTIVMVVTTTTVKISDEVYDVYTANCNRYRNGKVIGDCVFSYMPVSATGAHADMERVCGEYGDRSPLPYWLSEDTLPNVAALLCTAK